MHRFMKHRPEAEGEIPTWKYLRDVVVAAGGCDGLTEGHGEAHCRHHVEDLPYDYPDLLVGEVTRGLAILLGAHQGIDQQQVGWKIERFTQKVSALCVHSTTSPLHRGGIAGKLLHFSVFVNGCFPFK